MPRRSKVQMLPKAVKQWLHEQLIEGNFAGYEALSQELKNLGYDLSRASVHRYGKAFEERLNAIKVSTEQAQAVMAAAPDNEDAMNQALVRLTQQRLFDLLLEIKVDPSKINMPALTRAIAQIGRVSIGVKEYADKIQARTQDAAESAEVAMKEAGLNKGTISSIKTKILGIIKK